MAGKKLIYSKLFDIMFLCQSDPNRQETTFFLFLNFILVCCSATKRKVKEVRPRASIIRHVRQLGQVSPKMAEAIKIIFANKKKCFWISFLPSLSKLFFRFRKIYSQEEKNVDRAYSLKNRKRSLNKESVTATWSWIRFFFLIKKKPVFR